MTVFSSNHFSLPAQSLQCVATLTDKLLKLSDKTHTIALLSRFTNCAPDTRVLTSQGSYSSFLAVLLEAALTLNVSLFPPTQLPETHPFYDIHY